MYRYIFHLVSIIVAAFREQFYSQNYPATHESFAKPSNYHAIASRTNGCTLFASISTDQRNNEERLLRRLPIPSWRTIKYRAYVSRCATLSKDTESRIESSRVRREEARRGEARRGAPVNSFAGRTPVCRKVADDR